MEEFLDNLKQIGVDSKATEMHMSEISSDPGRLACLISADRWF
jgi:hypothetical protein